MTDFGPTSPVAAPRPGSELYPRSPLGERDRSIPTGRDVAWQPLVDYRRHGVSDPRPLGEFHDPGSCDRTGDMDEHRHCGFACHVIDGSDRVDGRPAGSGRKRRIRNQSLCTLLPASTGRSDISPHGVLQY